MAGINFAGEYNIQELKLFTSAGNVIDLSGSYMTMNIYEDIFSPCMTGDITVVDTNAILMNAPVTGQDFLSFKTQLLQEETKNNPTKKAALIKEIVRSIAIIPDHITRAVFIKDCSKKLQISEAILTQEVARVKRQESSR